MAGSASSFTWEDFLVVKLPDYESECFALARNLVLVVVFWIVAFPIILQKLAGSTAEKSNVVESQPKETTTEENEKPVEKDDKSNGNVRGKKAKKAKKVKKAEKIAVSNGSALSSGFLTHQNSVSSTASTVKHDNTTEKMANMDANVATSSGFSSIMLMVSVVYVLITSSPYNQFVARGVFQFPLFTAEECAYMIEIAERAAKLNYEAALVEEQYAALTQGETNQTIQALLMEPVGWQKMRHSNYPTTDLNLVTDPFSKDDLNWLKEKLDARLAPVLSRIYGIPRSAIRANDMFVVRYDADTRARLENHTDDSDISVNVLLTDNFEGGGTRFWNRHEEEPFAHVQPTNVGQTLTHSARINHEGMTTTAGTRVIFVGFLSVDRIDPFTTTPTGLGFFASWLSFPWLNTKFVEAIKARRLRKKDKIQKWNNNKYIQAWFLDLANVIQIFGDMVFNHHVNELIREKHASHVIKLLDAEYENGGKDIPKASWFAGQQINIDIDGTLTSEWTTRAGSSNRFMELQS